MTDAFRPRWKQFLSRASRSQGFLWKFALGAILAGVAVGYVVSRLQPAGPGKFRQRVLALSGLPLEERDPKRQRNRDPNSKPTYDANLGAAVIATFGQQLADPSVTFRQILRTVGQLAPYLDKKDHEKLRPFLLQRFSPQEADLAIDYLAACDPDDRVAYERLRTVAAAVDAPRFAHYAFGRVEMDREHYLDAFTHFHREGERTDAFESRWMAIQALRSAKDFAALAKLSDEPRYAELFTTGVRLDIAIGKRDWRAIAKWVPITQYETFERGVLIMTLITGIAWGFFLVHLGEMPRLFSMTALLCLAGFVFGVLSTTATVYFVVLQDDILKFAPGEDAARTLAYFIGGVGAREELAKLLLFVPLLPMLIKRDDELEALLVASFVGLGFAVEENGSYFLMSEVASAPGRFLTANFFHIALTGMNGLALFRACTRGASGLNDFLFVFPITVLAHGGYDAFFELPQFDEGGYVSMVIFILFSAYYFRRAHELRGDVRMTISLTGSFVFGMSLLVAAMVVYEMTNLGAGAGAMLIGTEILGSAILLFMFFRVFNEPLFP